MATEDPFIPVAYGILNTAFSIALSYPLSLGEWGCPKLGVEGIGHAMSISSLITWAALRTHFLLRENYNRFSLWDYRSISWKGVKRYLGTYIPLGLSNSIGTLEGFIRSQFIDKSGSMSKADKVVSAAYSASSALYQQMDQVLLGYSSAISALISNKDPRKGSLNEVEKIIEKRNIGRYMNFSTGLSLGITLLFSSFPLIFQEKTLDFFGKSLTEEGRDLAKLYLWFNALNTVFGSYAITQEANVHGLQDVILPFIFDVSINTLALTLAAIATYSEIDPNLVVIAGFSSSFMGAVTYFFRSQVVIEDLFNPVEQMATGICQSVRGFFNDFFYSDSIEEEFF